MNLLRPRHLVRLSTDHINFWNVYLIALVFNFHSLLIAYTNPTFIENYVNRSQIGLLYSIGSVGSLFLFIYLPTILKAFGNVTVTIISMLLSIIALALIGSAFNTTLLIIGFIFFQVINPIIYFNIDIFSETLIGKNESGTGRIRGLTLSLTSLAAMLAPLSISLVVGDNTANLSKLYYIAIAVGVIYTLIIIGVFRRFFDPIYHRTKVLPLLKQCFKIQPIRVVLITHFLLQIFFTWTVIYIPLYLATVIKLPWSQIGSIIAAGLLAYVICEYPIGIVADKYIGEKEMMAIGFFILAITVSTIAYMPASTTMIVWMIIMFISRTGASLVEVTTESYFFKKVDGEDANLIGIFRLMRPLSVLVGSLLGSISLIFLPFHLAFLVLAFVMVVGIFVTLALQDTR